MSDNTEEVTDLAVEELLIFKHFALRDYLDCVCSSAVYRQDVRQHASNCHALRGLVTKQTRITHAGMVNTHEAMLATSTVIVTVSNLVAYLHRTSKLPVIDIDSALELMHPKGTMLTYEQFITAIVQHTGDIELGLSLGKLQFSPPILIAHV